MPPLQSFHCWYAAVSGRPVLVVSRNINYHFLPKQQNLTTDPERYQKVLTRIVNQTKHSTGKHTVYTNSLAGFNSPPLLSIELALCCICLVSSRVTVVPRALILILALQLTCKAILPSANTSVLAGGRLSCFDLQEQGVIVMFCKNSMHCIEWSL